MAALRRSPLAEGVVVAIAAVGVLLLMDLYVRDSPAPKNDELIYERMADAPFDPHTFPFAYRVGVPTLVHILPLDHTASFSLLAWLSSGVCAGVGYLLLRRFAVDKRLAAALSLLVAVSPTLLVVSLRQGRSVDPESVAIILAGTLAIFDRRPAILGAIVLVGVFVRETALFLVPFAYAVWAERPWDRRAAMQTLVVAVPGIAAYAALRLSLPTLYRERVIGYGSFVGGRKEILSAAAEDPATEARRLATAFGPLWLQMPLALRESSFARRGLALVACCVVSMLFALDWGRIVFLALPVFLVGAGVVLQRRPRWAAPSVAALAALSFGYAVYMEDFGGAQDGIIDTGPAAYPLR